MDEIIYASASEIARAIREREVSAEEVTGAYLARVEEVNPKLNAFVQVTGDAARGRARRLRAASWRGLCTACRCRLRTRSTWRAS